MDLEDPFNFQILVVLRMIMEIFSTSTMLHPDEYYQGTEVAYQIVFGRVDLPWEWFPEYRLRNVLYQHYLAIPLYILRQLSLDYQPFVRIAPYMAHMLLVIYGDYQFYKLAKRVIGESSSRIALLVYLSNSFFNQHMIRCFSNSLECILHVALFNHFLDISKKLDRHICLFCFYIVFAFGVRNTAPISWVPLVFYRIFSESLFCVFLQAGILVALPAFAFVVAIDSWYYGQFTITGWNFLRINIIEKRSEEFGSSSSWMKFLLRYYLHTLA